MSGNLAELYPVNWIRYLEGTTFRTKDSDITDIAPKIEQIMRASFRIHRINSLLSKIGSLSKDTSKDLFQVIRSKIKLTPVLLLSLLIKITAQALA